MKKTKIQVQQLSTVEFIEWMESFSEAAEKLNDATKEMKALLAERPQMTIFYTAAEESESDRIIKS
jgi:truncated hemoglobin YjbI